MEFQNGENSTNLLKAQSHIWNHMFNFINSMSLKCVVDLDIPDIIHNYGKPMPLSKLIASLPIHQSKTNFIHRLMRMTTHSGIFSQQNVTENELEVEYVLNGASILLLKNHPMSVTPFLQVINDPILTKPWYQLASWLKNNDVTPFETTHGMLFWDYTGCEPKLNNLFNDAMASDTQLLTSVVTEKCKEVFSGLDSLVDVGGCTGTMAKALAKSFPQMECTVLDLPHVVAGLQGSENLKYIGGDMFKSIPPADAILMKTVITMINHAIGASGVVSKEFKAIVAEYGQIIMDLLLAEAQPKKIYSQIGLCTFFGTRGVNVGIESVVDEHERKSSGGLHSFK